MPTTTLPDMAGKGRPPLNRTRFVASLPPASLAKLDDYARAEKIKRPDALERAVALLPEPTPAKPVRRQPKATPKPAPPKPPRRR